MKVIPILLVILIFITISIVVYSKSLKHKDTDCVVSDWSSFSDCSKPCGGGTRTRTRTVIKNKTGKGLILTETESCNTQQCNPMLSYSYDGTIDLSSEDNSSVYEIKTIGIINTNTEFLLSSINFSSIYVENIGTVEIDIYIQRNGEGYIYIGFYTNKGSSIYETTPIDSDLKVKQGDVILMAIGLYGKSSITLRNPTVTLNVDCRVGDFEDQTGCLDIEGNLASCGGIKTQVRPVIQEPLYGGLECPTLTKTVECTPCPILSYSYDGEIYADVTGKNIKSENIGIINTDFVISKFNISSSKYESRDQISETKCSYVNIHILRNDNEVFGTVLQIRKTSPTINIDILLASPILLKKGDIIRIDAIATGELCYTRIINPKVKFIQPV